MRAFLRQDPDIILVGEIRDKETAGIAVEAALTGHLLDLDAAHQRCADDDRASRRNGHRAVHDFVVAALRLRAAPAAPRLQDTAGCLTSPEGREKEILEKAHRLERADFQGAIRKGCPNCGGSGYKGRVGIHELMVTNEELIEAINKELEVAELKKHRDARRHEDAAPGQHAQGERGADDAGGGDRDGAAGHVRHHEARPVGRAARSSTVVDRAYNARRHPFRARNGGRSE